MITQYSMNLWAVLVSDEVQGYWRQMIYSIPASAAWEQCDLEQDT